MRKILEPLVELKADEGEHSFEGYASIFNTVDRDGDIVIPGAFKESLGRNLPAFLWQHNAKEPIGRFLNVREDSRGLYVKGKLGQTGRGGEAYELMKMGALDGLSIGFITRESSRDKESGARIIHKADLLEISLVTFPANELARVETVKQYDLAMGGSKADQQYLLDDLVNGLHAKARRLKKFSH